MNLFVEQHRNPILRKAMVPFECVNNLEKKTFYVSVPHLLCNSHEYFSRIFFPQEYGFGDVMEPYELLMGETIKGVEDALRILHDQHMEGILIEGISIHTAITFDRWMIKMEAYNINHKLTEDVLLPITKMIVTFAAENPKIKLKIDIPEGYYHPIEDKYDLVFSSYYLPAQFQSLSQEERSKCLIFVNRLYFLKREQIEDVKYLLL